MEMEDEMFRRTRVRDIVVKVSGRSLQLNLTACKEKS